MQFIDKVKIKLKAGNGGNGLVSFAHLKYNPLGGPNGGDGGDGGSIIFVADSNKSTLLELRYKKIIRAKDGENGKTNNMYGRSQEDVKIHVPVGTIVKDLSTNQIIADLSINNQEEIICLKGKGGLGNHHFATSKNSAPEYAKMGTLGEEKEVEIELKLLADVGLVGYPSVGKSTLLSVVSKARPEIADYPFTTLTPQLGMVYIDDYSFVMADLPGLIEGASQGKGLGLEFLKHIERCRIIVHVLDMGSDDPINDYETINNELKQYPGNLDQKRQVVVCNKMDLDEDERKYKLFISKYPKVETFKTTTIIHEGLQSLLYRLKDILIETPYQAIFDPKKEEETVVYKYEKPKEFSVFNEGNGIFRIESEKIFRLFEKVDFDDEQSVLKFAKVLTSMEVDEELRKLGCKKGDKVFIKDYGFDFIEE